MKRFRMTAEIQVSGYAFVEVSANSAAEATAMVERLILDHGYVSLDVDRREESVFLSRIEIDDSELMIELAEVSDAEDDEDEDEGEDDARIEEKPKTSTQSDAT